MLCCPVARVRIIPPLLMALAVAAPAGAERIAVGKAFTHTSGAELRIEAVDFGDATISLEVSGRPSDRVKNLQFLAGATTVLVDDRGIRYELVPVTPNDRVTTSEQVSAGAEPFSATLVFNGPLVPGAQRVTLVTNAFGGDPAKPEMFANSPTPKFRIDLPLPTAQAGIVVAAGSPQGVVIAVNEVRRTPEGIDLKVTMTTGEWGGTLASSGTAFGLSLPDGGTLRARPDPNLPGFKVPPYSVVRGVLHFDGALPATAQKATLLINPGMQPSVGTPSLRLDVPLPDADQSVASPAKPI